MSELRELRLKHVQEPSEGYTRLSTLSALSRLHLHNCHLPSRDAVAELRSLRAFHVLVVTMPGQLPLNQLELVLPELSQLTELNVELYTNEGQLHPLPQELSGLDRLQRLCFQVGKLNADAHVPAGWPWLACVRRLALDAPVAAASTAALAAATRLERLALHGFTSVEPSHLGLVGLAAEHPSLLRLSVDERLANFRDAIRDAKRRKPALRVETVYELMGAVFGG